MNNLAGTQTLTGRDLAAGYADPIPSGHDEMIDAQGVVRPHWRGLLHELESILPEERRARAEALDKRVNQIGIAYDIFADPTAQRQRWTVDLAPLIISVDEWRWLETALQQRARLFDAILADIYGAQSLMRRGIIPPTLVFADPAFMRASLGAAPPGGHLQFYAADLARGHDGMWRVIDSHTETPAGVGSALANRVAHTHIAGDIFKAINARRVAAFFQDMQNNIARRSNRSAPRVALLTPGPHHEDYFSHAYLARYLGYLLVEGNDLRTAGDRIYLKTLEGLKEIDVIVRCVEGRTCDPIELDPTGFGGPVGLMQVVRQTPDLVVNSIGAAVVQNRGLGAYLPKLARHLLGEELMLADTPRLWLGDAQARAQALASPDKIVIRKTQEGAGRPGRADLGRSPASLEAGARELLLRESELHGERLVAEHKLGFGTTPSFNDGRLQPAPFAVRLFVTRGLNGFTVMPGGLAMTIDPSNALGLSAPEGRTRDVWIAADGSMPHHTSLWRPTVEAAHVERSQRVTQSRAADDLYWLGRYSERADWSMRVLRSAIQRQQEDGLPVEGQIAARRCLEVLLTDKPNATPPHHGEPLAPAIEALIGEMMRGTSANRALSRTLDGLHRVATLTRDRLSHEAWQTLDRFRPTSEWRAALKRSHASTALDVLEEGLAAQAAFAGLMHENMTRNYGWSFLDMGRRLSRAQNLSEAVAALFADRRRARQADETSSLRFLLEVADSFITYRSRYRLDPMLPLVLDLLLIDESNPRSLAFQLEAISRHLVSLPQANAGIVLPEERRQILALSTAVRLADVESIAQGDRDGLAALMSRMTEGLPNLSDAIGRRYFSLLEERPHRLQARFEPRR